jgi:hypothetical protein
LVKNNNDSCEVWPRSLGAKKLQYVIGLSKTVGWFDRERDKRFDRSFEKDRKLEYYNDESGVADRRDADDRREASGITLHSRCFHKESRNVGWCIRRVMRHDYKDPKTIAQARLQVFGELAAIVFTFYFCATHVYFCRK